MAESRLYKIAQPRNLLRSELHCLIQTGPPATDYDITESDQRVIFPTPPLFFLPCPKQLGCMGNDSTAWRILLTSIGAVMLTSKEYLQQAEECSQLANATSDVYVKEALTELASDFKAMAKDLEQRNER